MGGRKVEKRRRCGGFEDNTTPRPRLPVSHRRILYNGVTDISPSRSAKQWCIYDVGYSVHGRSVTDRAGSRRSVRYPHRRRVYQVDALLLPQVHSRKDRTLRYTGTG
jgi:hypothetical protein